MSKRTALLVLALTVLWASLVGALLATSRDQVIAPEIPSDSNLTPDGQNYRAPWNR
jgi:hypothetical protein